MDPPQRTTTSSRLYESYRLSTRKKRLSIVVLASLSVLAVLFSMCIGSVGIPMSDVLKVISHALLPWTDGPDNPWYSQIVLGIRLPRALMCILCGISLAVAGAVMQNILRNPLVSPFTLGVSSAASFGAAIAIVFGSVVFGQWFFGTFFLFGVQFSNGDAIMLLSAFLFGLISIAFVILLSRARNISRSTVILSGVILSYFFQAGISFVKYVSSDDALREITLWLMGGMWNSSWSAVAVVLPVMAISLAYVMSLAPEINTLSAGDEVAESLGINIKRLRNHSLVVCTAMVSVCIAFTGIIGFVGLVAPHIMRMMLGNDSRYLIPASGLFGALLLLVSDTFSRYIIAPSELPVGIVMYIVGGIFFIWMVTSRKRGVEI